MSEPHKPAPSVDIQLDASQRTAWDKLATLAQTLHNQGAHKALWPFKSRAAIKGLYLVGGVGRGKTMLMDRFVRHLDTLAYRSHFHRFMHEVHQRLHQLNKEGFSDPVKIIATQYAGQMRVLCLDDLWVSDITDAMLLGGLFKNLHAAGVCLVITSNIPPQALYHNGLQRARFLPTIELLEQVTEVVTVDSGTDYRSLAYGQKSLWFVGQHADQELMQCYQRITQYDQSLSLDLTCQGRLLRVKSHHSDSILIDFNELCIGARSTEDYIELTNRFKLIAVLGLPIFSDDELDPLRRFIALIDECYDRKRCVALSCLVTPWVSYSGIRLYNDWQRTQSRLHEMLSVRWQSPHAARP